MTERRKAREFALQILFQREFLGTTNIADLIDLFQGHFSLNTELIQFTKSLTEAVVNNQEEIDKLITKYSKNWNIKRLSLIDLSLLRMCICEMLFFQQDPTPPKVAIDEAIEIAKKYSSEDSPQFINGILDQVLNKECKI